MGKPSRDGGSFRERLASTARSDAPAFGFLLVIAALSTRYSMPLMDDVYITLQHSLNLVRGHGLVYNEGERVLGTSAPLYALLIALFVPVFRDPVALAIYAWPVALASTALLAYRLIGRGPIGLLGAILLCTDPSLDGIVGMETAFFVACLFWALDLYAADRLKAAALLLGALPIIRPDGVFLIAAVSLDWLIQNRRSLDRAFLKRHTSSIALLLLPLAVWCAAATAYYGVPLPNSFIGKYYQSKITWWFPDPWTFRYRVAERLLELRYAFLSAGVVVAFALALFRNDRVLRAAALFTLFYGAAYSVSRVPSYANYYFPLFAMMTLLALRAAATLVGPAMSRLGIEAKAASASRARLVATALVAAAGLWLVARASDLRLLSPIGPPDPQMAYVKIAGFLKKHAPSDASVGAMEIGIIGYYSERKIVDFAGLTSPGVMHAVANGNRRFALDRFHPDYVVARYPAPLMLEGGLTEGELVSSYRFLFGADGVGVFRAIQSEPDAGLDAHHDAARLAAHRDTVFILRQRIDPSLIAALNAELEPLGSVVTRSLAGKHPDLPKRHAYLSFKQGRIDQILPMLEPGDLSGVSRLPALEFDRPSEKFIPWSHIALRGPESSVIHLSIDDVDGYVAVPIQPFAPWLAGTLRIRLRIEQARNCRNDKAEGAFYWVTNLDKTWGSHEKFVSFPVDIDGDWHEIRIDLSENEAWNGSGIVTELRYDPVYCVADADVDFFRLE